MGEVETTHMCRKRSPGAALLLAVACLAVVKLLQGESEMTILQEGGVATAAPSGEVPVPSNKQDLQALSPRRLAEKERRFDAATQRAVALKAQYELAKRAAVTSKEELTAFKAARIEAHKRYVHKAAAYMEIKKSAGEQRRANTAAKAAEVATKAAERAQARAMAAQHQAHVFDVQAKQDKAAAMKEASLAARHAEVPPVPVSPHRTTVKKTARQAGAQPQAQSSPTQQGFTSEKRIAWPPLSHKKKPEGDMHMEAGEGSGSLLKPARKHVWQEADDEFQSMKLASSTQDVEIPDGGDGSEEVAEDIVGKILSQGD